MGGAEGEEGGEGEGEVEREVEVGVGVVERVTPVRIEAASRKNRGRRS